MKEYLQLFRDQAFNGAFALLKRVLVSNILITIILSIISMAVIIPLILKGIGWGIADLVGLKEKMQDIPKDFSTPDEVKDYFLGMLGEVNYPLLSIAGIFMLFISAYQYVVFFKLNDNTVRTNNTGIMDALKSSLSSKIFSMLGLYCMLCLISISTILIYVLALVPIYMASKIAGVLIGFLLFFVVVLFIIRFLIAPAALIHGNLGIFESIVFSFRKLTWKRAGILFLMGLVFIIALALVSGLVSSITTAIFGINSTNMTAFVISQIISSAIGAILSAFLYSSLTALYFRYSNDESEDTQTVEEHLIN